MEQKNTSECYVNQYSYVICDGCDVICKPQLVWGKKLCITVPKRRWLISILMDMISVLSAYTGTIYDTDNSMRSLSPLQCLNMQNLETANSWRLCSKA